LEITKLIDVLQQNTFISAVLAGFAVTLFVGLLHIAPQRRVVAYAAGAAMIAAVLLIVSTITGIAGIVSVSFESDPRSAVMGGFSWAAYSFLVGIVAFLTSLGLSGWVRSSRLGMVSSSVAGIALLALIYFLVVVVKAF